MEELFLLWLRPWACKAPKLRNIHPKVFAGLLRSK